MSFSTSFCITNTGVQSLGESLEIYSDSDSYTSLITTATLSNITGTNCPYTITVPDGTTKIKIFDPVTTCYVIIKLQTNDICETCDLGFDTYSSNSIGRISAGNLTGTCDNPYTDYLINWYKDGDFNTPVFTSGKGTLFTPYIFTHPLTGTSAVFTLEGTYTPIIEKIEIDGLIFSKTGGTGTIESVLDCFNDQTLEVTGFTCDNGGSSDLSQYSHRVQFQGQSSSGVIPQPLTSSFRLKSTTKYFAWKFKGDSVPDKLKLTLLGASYPVPIILEYWDVGGELPSVQVRPQTLPKSAATSNYLTKVTCLTGLTINDNDLIIMEISPNTGNTQTNWDFYFTCLESFNGTYCDNPLPYKLIKSSITGITASCDRIYVNFTLSGACTNITGLINSDVNKYLPLNTQDYTGNGRQGPYQTSQLYLSGKSCGYYNAGYGRFCSVPTTNTIKYIKTPGLFRIECSSISDISHYYNPYNVIKNNIKFSYSSTTNDYRYYTSFSLDYPNSTDNSNCGDGTVKRTLCFHTSSQVTTGGTSGNYWIEFTMPTISNGMTYTSCDQNCVLNTNNVVNTINIYSTGTSYNYTGTTNTGSKYTQPIDINNYLTETNTPFTAQTIESGSSIVNYLNETYPFSASSPTTYTLIPTLSGTTWPNIESYFYVSDPTPTSNLYRFEYRRYIFYLKFTLFNPLDYSDYKIESRIISSNGELISSNYELAYVFSGGTEQYWNPAYVIDA
jgi:hypothetical protein